MNSMVHFVPSTMRITPCRIAVCTRSRLLRCHMATCTPSRVSLGNLLQPCFERPRAMLRPRRLSRYVAFQHHRSEQSPAAYPGGRARTPGTVFICAA